MVQNDGYKNFHCTQLHENFFYMSRITCDKTCRNIPIGTDLHIIFIKNFALKKKNIKKIKGGLQNFYKK